MPPSSNRRRWLSCWHTCAPRTRHASWQSFPGEFRIKVARRIAQLGASIGRGPSTTALIEAKLRSLHTVGALTVAGGASAIAEILNHSDRQTERQILGELESEDSELVEQIRASLFTFDDVIALDTRSSSRSFGGYPPRRWPPRSGGLSSTPMRWPTFEAISPNGAHRRSTKSSRSWEPSARLRSTRPRPRSCALPGSSMQKGSSSRMQRRGGGMTTWRGSGSGVAPPAGPWILDGQGLSVRRRPLDPGRPIDYTSLSTMRADGGPRAGGSRL